MRSNQQAHSSSVKLELSLNTSLVVDLLLAVLDTDGMFVSLMKPVPLPPPSPGSLVDPLVQIAPSHTLILIPAAPEQLVLIMEMSM